MRYQFVLGVAWVAVAAAGASALEHQHYASRNSEQLRAAVSAYANEPDDQSPKGTEGNEGKVKAGSTPSLELERSFETDARSKNIGYSATNQHRSPTQVIQPYAVDLVGDRDPPKETRLEEGTPDETAEEGRKGVDEAERVISFDDRSYDGVGNVADFGQRVSVKQTNGLAGDQVGGLGDDGRIRQAILEERYKQEKRNRSPGKARERVVSLGKLSGPIVVPELEVVVKDEQLSDTRAGDGDTVEASSSLESPSGNFDERKRTNNYQHGATSANVLKPLEAGLALGNASPTELTDLTFDPSKPDYEEYRPEAGVEKGTDAATNPVEIQKSIELYLTAPVQEIHYPAEYVPEPAGYKNDNEIPEENRNNMLYRTAQLDQQLHPEDFRGRYSTYRGTIGHDSSNDPTRFQIEKYESRLRNAQPATAPVTNEINVRETDVDESSKKPKHQPSAELGNFQQQYSNEASLTGQQPAQIIFGYVGPNEIGSRSRLESKNLPRVYPVEKLIEKMVHVAHPIEIEKLVEKRIPYPIEKLVEKQVPIPQPYPVHVPVQIPVEVPIHVPVPLPVPVDRIVEKPIRIAQLYPVRVNSLIEKKLPFAAVQRFGPQPQLHPIHHSKKSQLYTIERVIEKAIGRDPYSIETLRLVQSPLSYNPQWSGEWAKEQGQSVSFVRSAAGQSKKYVSSHRPPLPPPPPPPPPPSHFIAPAPAHHWNQPYGTTTKERVKEEHGINSRESVEPLSPAVQPKSYGSAEPPSKSAAQQPSNALQPLRTPRQEGSGSFRQSKMEYGFKPPMVPSVQYDEKTATKVE